MKSNWAQYNLFTWIILLFPLVVFSQNNIWYFGDHAGIDFNTTPPAALTNSQMIAHEGCASISDESGNLLFYTNGVTVWNASHNVMPNGNGLMGDLSTTMGALIVPMPGDTNNYYILTIDDLAGSGGMRYSIVDMTLAGGLGNVTTKNAVLHGAVTEKMVALQNCDGSVWVISHDWGSNDFYADLITPTGFSPTVVSSAGTSHTGGGLGVINAVGEMALSQQGDRLAIAMRDGHIFEVLDFNSVTGVVSNPVTLNSSTYYRSYGVEFSPDGNLLYGSCLNTGEIYQFNLNAGTASNIMSSAVQVANFSQLTGALKLGPDGKIYVARTVGQTNGRTSLAVINSPNSIGVACNIVDNSFSLAGKYSLIGLPNHMLYPPGGASQLFLAGDTTICTGDSTLITISGSDSIQWIQGASSQLKSMYLAPATTTQYKVVDMGSVLCADTLVFTVHVDTLSAVSIVASDTVICQGKSATLSAVGGSNIQWSGGTFSNNDTVVVSPNVTTDYYVTSGSAGCQSTDTITIAVVPGISNLTFVGDTLVCKGEWTSIQVLGSTNVQWIKGITSQSTNVYLGPDTLTQYAVYDKNAAPGCADTLRFYVHVQPIMNVEIVASDTLICQGEPVEMYVTGHGSHNVVWSGGGINFTTDTVTVYPTTSTDFIVQAGNGECGKIDTISIQVSPPSALTFAGDTTICFGDSSKITVSGSSNIQWVSGASSTSSILTLSPAATTQYSVVDMSVPGKCADTLTFTINVEPLSNVEILATDSIICEGDSVILSANGTGTHPLQWGGGVSSTLSSLVVKPTITTDYFVIAGNGECGKTDTVTITVLPAGNPLSFTGDTTICLGDSSIINILGSNNVQWIQGASSTSSNLNLAPASTTTYTVVDMSVAPKCADTLTFTIRVDSIPTAVIQYSDTLICQGDSVTLTALGNGNIQWSGGSTSTQSSIVVKPNFTTTYYLTRYNNNCSRGDTITVTVLPGITASFSDDTGPCGLDVSFTSGTVGADSWIWDMGDGTVLYGPNVDHSYSEPGSYKVILSVTKAACGLTDTVSHIIEVTDAVAYPEIVSEESDCNDGNYSFKVNNTLPRYTYSWDFGNGDKGLGANPSVTYDQTGIYWIFLNVEDTLCKRVYIDSVYIQLNEIINQTFIPNSFTPNHDGINEVFMISGGECGDGDYMAIYNRWGEMIFRSDNPYSEFWDGTFNGEDAIEGVYYYILFTKDKEMKGIITLIR